VARDLRGVLDAVLAGILVLDDEGRVELVNSAASRILETSAESAQGLPVERLLGSDHSIAKLARSVLSSGRDAADSERRVERRGAEPMVVDASASPLFGDDQRVSGVVLFLRDRTIQKRLEELVAERERLSAFGHIAAGIAHEVKNPLGGIRGAAEILAARADDERLKEAAELVVREVRRIAALVDDLMVFARDDEIRLAPVNIHRVLDHVLELHRMDPSSRAVRVERAFDPSIPELLADESRLTQVFLNLTQNAVQAMGAEGGTLTIRTRMPLAHLLSTTGEDSVPALLVTVADTGPGIAPEVLAELATPFFTTRKGGTGLGLAVSRHWVTRHGGTLRVDSTLGEGTSVRVALPLRRAT
jgi:two-component system nitrogen regulation sensor histidine kinase GlnL